LDITDIKGVGDKLANKIIEHFGSQGEFLQAARNYEVDRLASIDGVSQRRAVEIINAVLGNPTEEFLKTDRAVQIYEDIIYYILDYASTEYAKNRVMLLSPTKDLDKINKTLEMVMKAKERVVQLPRDNLSAMLKNVYSTRGSKAKYDTSKAILVESQEDYTTLMDRGLNQYSNLLTIQEIEGLEEFELIIYVYSEGILDLVETPNMVMVRVDAEDLEIVPEMVLSYYHENFSLLENILKIRKILGYESVLSDVLDVLNSLKSLNVDERAFDDAVDRAKEKADKQLEKAIKKVDLSGEEVLELLNKDTPPKIQLIFDRVLKEAKEDIKKETGVSLDPFIQKYPLKIDQQELERVKQSEMANRQINAFEERVNAASQLKLLKDKVENEIQEILEFDYQFTLGCFALHYDLHPPEMGDGFSFQEGLHLNLALEDSVDVQRIDYSLESPDNVVLLTGANSGGKTTLLETMAQICIMSQMGLPVCAREARVKMVDELYFFSKKRSLDAGAFESFLKTFMPIVVREQEKIILLDELEAITELEAAVKIISSFINFIQDSKSFAVIVTHMAREILKNTEVRVDGIEAKGLDKEYNLIVDRTPRMNYFARSTPELILKMVYERSDGKLRGIYGRMLKKF
jgi:DNA mismatch repair protein MutS2